MGNNTDVYIHGVGFLTAEEYAEYRRSYGDHRTEYEKNYDRHFFL